MIGTLYASLLGVIEINNSRVYIVAFISFCNTLVKILRPSINVFSVSHYFLALIIVSMKQETKKDL